MSVQTCGKSLFHVLHKALCAHGVWDCGQWSGRFRDLYEHYLFYMKRQENTSLGQGKLASSKVLKPNGDVLWKLSQTVAIWNSPKNNV